MVSVDNLYPQRKTLCAAADFAWSIYKKHVSTKPDKNTAISPFLVEHSLILILAGADGETAAEIKRAIGLDGWNMDDIIKWISWVGDESYKDGYCEVKLCSGVLFKLDEKVPLKWKFREYSHHYQRKKGFYRRSSLINLEKFANNLLYRQTCSQLEKIFVPSEFTESTSIVSSSGIYLRPIWAPKNYFASRLNDPYPFWKSDDGKLLTTCTFSSWAQPEFVETTDYRCVGLEVEYTNYAIYFVVPNYENVTGLDALTALEERLSGEGLLGIIDAVAAQRNHNHCWKMTIELPNVVIDEIIPLEAYLKSMGIEAVFDPDRCNLSKMTDRHKGMHVSIARQSVKVKLNCTSAVYSDLEKSIEKKGVPNPKFPTNWTGPKIRFDQPFMFFVFDYSTRVIMLIGRCCMPIISDKLLYYW